jgi:4-amino-4-deoxy-L-arabinose transferase-like glycosyltransferase
MRNAIKSVPVLRWWASARARSLLVPLAIFLVALLPRLLLAHSLDLVTDEGVYIPIGRLDYRLLTTLDIGSTRWLDNYEAPALPKLLIGLGSLLGASLSPHGGWLFGARLPGLLLGTLLPMLAYLLATPLLGRLPAAIGALALALSPWIAYFAAIAYLDPYMVVCVTLAILLTWHAARRPKLLPWVGVLLGLGFACKYTALFALLPIAGYLTYYYACVTRRRPPRQLALLVPVAVLALYLADPAIWADPFNRLWNSVQFQYFHAATGHNEFWNGRVWDHVPPGEAFFILLAKMSLFVTIPALLALPWALIRLLRARRHPAPLDDRAAFALCWLGGLLLPFALLNIVVGTHYMLPLAPAATFVGAWALLRAGTWASRRVVSRLAQRNTTPVLIARHPGLLPGTVTVVLALLLLAPTAYGLATVRQAEGYTSEWLPGENGALQVAYPGYADGVAWIAAHTRGDVTITLISTEGAVKFWLEIRPQDFPARLHIQQARPDETPAPGYVIWPEHLIQRGYPTLPHWRDRIAATIGGGATTYCYVLHL